MRSPSTLRYVVADAAAERASRVLDDLDLGLGLGLDLVKGCVLIGWAASSTILDRTSFHFLQNNVDFFARRDSRTVGVRPHQPARDVAVGDEKHSGRQLVAASRTDLVHLKGAGKPGGNIEHCIVHHRADIREARYCETILRFVMAAVCLSLVSRPAIGQDKPKLLAVDGFMFKGVFTELDTEQMKRRLSLAEIEKLHFDGKSTPIEAILKLMAASEELADG